MSVKKILLQSLGYELKNIISQIPSSDFDLIQEIRIRIDKPLIIRLNEQEFFLKQNGTKTTDIKYAYSIKPFDISSSLELMSNFSLYSFESEIKNGFITLEGGHRVGLCGSVVMRDGIIQTIKNISAINIRIAHQIIGCADKLMPYLVENGQVCHTIIVSPPRCGKTTLLRDVIRQFSNGVKKLIDPKTIGVVDERSEIAGCYLGVPQNDVGLRTDVLDSCAKDKGMTMLLRSMSPQIIAVDEIGSVLDIHAIEEIINAGINIICTVHGRSIDDILKKPVLNTLMSKNIFSRIVILSFKNGAGTLELIADGEFNKL